MKLSIVTICYNSEKTIEDTIKSVLMQKYQNYEYIIIDGKSTDKTLDIIKKYEKKFHGKMKYVSEKDKGLYDAMNKGIKMCSGDYIGTINSDDVLIDENVFDKIVSGATADIVYADVLYCSENLDTIERDYISGPKGDYSWCPAHPTMYIKNSIYKKIGAYNLTYKVAADFDFMTRLNLNNCTYNYINDYLVLMRMGGASNGISGYKKGIEESIKIFISLNIKHPYYLTLKRCIHIFNQIIFSKFKRKRLNKVLEKRQK